MKKYSVVMLGIGLFALVGCGQSADEPSNTHVLSGFGFSIDYPEGWTAETRATVTHISELAEDHAHAFRDDEYSPAGYTVAFDHRTVSFLQGIGLKENPTLDDLLEFNADTFDWQVTAVEEAEIFGVPALRVRVMGESGRASDNFMGFIDDEVFLLGLGAPTVDARDEFASKWEEMLASLRPVGE